MRILDKQWKNLGTTGKMFFIIEGEPNLVCVDEIIGSPRVGSNIEKVNGFWTVQQNNTDPDCVGGVCPTR